MSARIERRSPVKSSFIDPFEGKLGKYLFFGLFYSVMATDVLAIFWFGQVTRIDSAELAATAALSCFIGVFIAIGVKSLGQLVFGRRAGMEFRRFALGPIGISKVAGRSEVFYTGRKFLSGFVYLVPPANGYPATMIRSSLLGGLVASAAWTFAITALFLLFVGSPPALATIAASQLLVASLLILIRSAVPHAAAGASSDALILRKLLRPGPGRDQTLAKFQISRDIAAGLRPREYSEASIKTQVELASLPVDRILALMLAYGHYADSNEQAKAEACLSDAYELVLASKVDLGELAGSVLATKAFVLADSHGEVEAAKAMLAKIQTKSEMLDYAKLIAKAAILVASRETHEAQFALDRAARALSRMHSRTGMSNARGTEIIARLRANIHRGG